MIQVALCGNLRLEDSDVLASLDLCAAARGVELAPIIKCASAVDLIDRVAHPGQKTLVDLVISDYDLQGLHGVQMVRELRDADCEVHVVLMADSPDDAAQALSLSVDGYLVHPVPPSSFEHVVGYVLGLIDERRRASVEFRFRDRARRLDLADIVFITTVDHDQVVHTTDGRRHAVRCSSKAMFDLVAHDKRFFKAGSSVIVNMAHVRLVTPRGSVKMSNGETVTVPTRLRKALESALFELSQ